MKQDLKETIEALKAEGATFYQVKAILNDIDELTNEEKDEMLRQFIPPDVVPPPIPRNQEPSLIAIINSMPVPRRGKARPRNRSTIVIVLVCLVVMLASAVALLMRNNGTNANSSPVEAVVPQFALRSLAGSWSAAMGGRSPIATNSINIECRSDRSVVVNGINSGIVWNDDGFEYVVPKTGQIGPAGNELLTLTNKVLDRNGHDVKKIDYKALAGCKLICVVHWVDYNHFDLGPNLDGTIGVSLGFTRNR